MNVICHTCCWYPRAAAARAGSGAALRDWALADHHTRAGPVHMCGLPILQLYLRRAGGRQLLRNGVTRGGRAMNVAIET